MRAFGWEEGVDNQEEEARRDEEGAALGDPRRCPRHPNVATSTPDGMFDFPCGPCEMSYEDEHDCDERCVNCVADDRGTDSERLYIGRKVNEAVVEFEIRNERKADDNHKE